MDIFGYILRRSIGISDGLEILKKIREKNVLKMKINETEMMKCRYAVKSIDIDLAENRYLLSGIGDGSIRVYDLEKRSNSMEPIAEIDRCLPHQEKKKRKKTGAHMYGISTIQWYPTDSGIFTSSSLDGTVIVWDTNTLEKIQRFQLNEKVYATSMSKTAASHTLIATGLKSPSIVLCDILSGGKTHSLVGHNEAVYAVAWSPASEYILASGSLDCSLRIWDIRKSGSTSCLMCLDQNNHQQHLKRKRSENPHFSAGRSAATAHSGAITGISFVPDGSFLMSTGRDNRLRLWNSSSGENMFVNYIGTSNSYQRGNTMALVQEGYKESAVVFHPNGNNGDIKMYKVHSEDGKSVNDLSHHYEAVNCCIYKQDTQELFSASDDCNICIWKPPTFKVFKERDDKDPTNLAANELDYWSDDSEEDSDNERFYFVPPFLRD